MLLSVILLLIHCIASVSSQFHDIRTAEIVNFLKNYTNLTERIDMTAVNKPIRPEGRSEGFTFRINKNISEASGHPYCGALIRDNWMCVGDRYSDVLRRTKPLNATRFGLHNFVGPTLIVASGNSFTAQLINTWLCYSKGAKIYSNMLCSANLCRMRTNSLLAVAKETILLLLDNDAEKTNDSYFDKLLATLRAKRWCPQIIIEGHQNDWHGAQGDHSHEINRFTSYVTHCPQAKLITLFAQHTGGGCAAEFMNCKDDLSSKHQCVPGPIVRSVEKFVDNLQYERLFVMQDPYTYYMRGVNYSHFEEDVWA